MASAAAHGDHLTTAVRDATGGGASCAGVTTTTSVGLSPSHVRALDKPHSLVHMANTSYRVGQKQLMFDGATERFTNNDAANALLSRSYRAPFTLPDKI